MAGFITKFGLGAGLFILIMFFGSFLLTESANEYGITVDSFYEQNIGDVDLDSKYQNTIFEAQKIQEGASIDSDAQDIAQLEGAITAEKTKINFFDVGKVGFGLLEKYILVDPFVTGILSSMLILMVGAAVFAFLSGRTP